MKNRDLSLDILRGLGIFLMVFDHVGWGNIVHTYIQSFHMPLFFVCSGYFFKYEVKSYKKKITGKCKALLIPYIIWGILIGVLLVSIRAIVKGSSVDWGTLFWKIITLRQSFLACWFLKVLFRRVYVRILYSIYF